MFWEYEEDNYSHSLNTDSEVMDEQCTLVWRIEWCVLILKEA